jgi:hypothetical protein
MRALFGVGTDYSLITPDVVIRPTLLADSSVNQGTIRTYGDPRRRAGRGNRILLDDTGRRNPPDLVTVKLGLFGPLR